MTDPSIEPGGDGSKSANESAARRSLIFFLGFALLGIALVFVLFGQNLFGADEPEPIIDQVPQLGTPASVAPTVDFRDAPEIGEVAPNFTLPDLQGNDVSLADFRGQPVVVNFWATWCGPCRIEMPVLQDTFEARQDEGLVILAVNREEDPAVVADFFYDEFNLTFTPLLDQEAIVADQYAVFNLPTTYFIDRSGEIIGFHRGPLTQGQIDDFLADMIRTG